MTDFTPPLRDQTFLLSHVFNIGVALPESGLDDDTIAAILEQAGGLARDVLAPINRVGDQHGAKLQDGVVTTAPGFRDAYAQYRNGGWNAVPFDPAYGGQGLPWVMAFAVQELWQSANMAFGLCPLLNQGAVEAIHAHASDELKSRYLEKLISGEWTGTMNLTEPQAGSDLAALRARAVKNADGTYAITGQKIFITYGEHDMADNIIHLVLARVDGAPEGVKGISLFVVPKFLPEGARNDLVCAGLEHKMGIHGSPTCTMQFGEKGGATGYLVGRENEGLKYMFTMMNNARLSVGLQGVAIAERATQQAVKFAGDRIQGKSMRTGQPTAIVNHPDVRRMLLQMKAMTLAGRAMAYDAALTLDRAQGGDAAAASRVAFLTPIVKSWCTDMAQEVTSLNVQVHGGMGFIEETGAAQLMRDARILPIYEGTNGIQALDLMARKLVPDNGAAYAAWRADAQGIVDALAALPGDDAEIIRESIASGLKAADAATEYMLKEAAKDPESGAAVATPYQALMGTVAGGVVLGRVAVAAQNALSQGGAHTQPASQAIVLARFYGEHVMPRAAGLSVTCRVGARTVMASDPLFT